jgi:hypothetical protein
MVSAKPVFGSGILALSSNNTIKYILTLTQTLI